MNRMRRDDDAPVRDLQRAPKPSPSSRSSSRWSPRTRRPPTLLIADDTADTRELYAMYFRGRGFTVFTAHDGEAAVQAAIECRPDVIVMDLAMPRLDGVEAARRIKHDSRTRKTHVIMLTGYPMKAVERGAIEAGADLFLTKPCLPEDLERHVNEVRRPKDAL